MSKYERKVSGATEETTTPVGEPGERSVPTPPAISAHAFYGVLGEIALVLDQATQASGVAILATLVNVVGNAIGFEPYLSIDNSPRIRCRYPVVLVGRTSRGRKHTAWRAVMDYVVTGAGLDGWTEAEHVDGNVKSGEYLVTMVRDAALGKKGDVLDAGVTDKRRIVYEPEFARLLKDIGRKDSTLSEVARQTADEPMLRTGAKHSKEKATNPHVSWHCMTTPPDLDRFLDDVLVSNGLANRFAPVHSQRTSAEIVSEVELDRLLSPLISDLKANIGAARRRGQVWPTADFVAVWRRMQNGIEALMTEDLAGDMEGRFGQHVLAAALIFALANGEQRPDLAHLEAAVALRKHSYDANRFYFGHKTGASLADEILRILLRTSTGVSRTQVNNELRRNRESHQIGAALNRLENLGLAEVVPQQPTGRQGRVAEVWKATESAFEKRSVHTFHSFLSFVSRVLEASYEVPKLLIERSESHEIFTTRTKETNETNDWPEGSELIAPSANGPEPPPRKRSIRRLTDEQRRAANRAMRARQSQPPKATLGTSPFRTDDHVPISDYGWRYHMTRTRHIRRRDIEEQLNALCDDGLIHAGDFDMRGRWLTLCGLTLVSHDLPYDWWHDDKYTECVACLHIAADGYHEEDEQ